MLSEVYFSSNINKFKLKTIIKLTIWNISRTHAHADESFQSENFKADVVLDTDQLNNLTTESHIIVHTKNNHVKHNLWIWTQKPLEDVVWVSV